MTQALNDEYCAGLWRNELVTTELCWSGDRHRNTTNLPTVGSGTYRAPSWSWACQDGPITPFDTRLPTEILPRIEITECNVKTATSDRTGAVTSGELRVSGWLATLQAYPRNPGDPLDLFFNGKRLQVVYEKCIVIDYTLSSSQLHFLPVQVRKPIRVLNEGLCWIVSGLLLIPTGAARGQFWRVGTFSFPISDLALTDQEELSNLVNEPWMEYETDCGDGKYITSII
ncbi:hypothetical protein BDW02DRAFT_601811 [Decorospora gaudefroyi]|uniref:Heterokaryon incompatibility domain-containing protein n=1 Tax=Decorospora gaudefroyi TaxID=184978 RepID=A0A6A5JZ89_9PLEO|nr:hypothetical protein BDW02DRAFT_601811 [Decorospora gaudefroyi]